MCSNYKPISRANSSWVESKFGCSLPPDPYRDDAYPTYSTPFVYIENGIVKCDLAQFGLVPPWASDKKKCGLKTYNARSETVHEKPSYRCPWRQRQFGLVLTESFYEPNWKTGKAVRWEIKRVDQSPLAIASIWERFTDMETGEILFSFSMLTVNATNHGVMNQFHRTEDEKRSVVVLLDNEYMSWLNADVPQARSMLNLPPEGFLFSEPSPRLAKVSKPIEQDLFS